MKLPGIQVKGIEGFESGRIPVPNVAARGEALGDLAVAAGQLAAEVENNRIATDLASATGAASQELSELRAKLETSRTIPADEVPDGIEFEFESTVINDRGDEVTIDNPFVFTHDVADEWWSTKSEEIIQNYASRIRNERARTKFVGEMQERYGAPGALAIARSSIEKSRAHAQATAQIAIQEVLASDAPTEQRESQAREIIARQMLVGADPLWVAQQTAMIGPNIDQIDVQNQVIRAQTEDELNMIEEEMWAGGNRMSAEQMRTLSTQIDKKRQDFDEARIERHQEGDAQATSMLLSGDLTIPVVNQMLRDDQINAATARVLRNSLNEGGTTKASNPFTLSEWRGEIVKLPYTGRRVTVTEKAEFLKRQIQFAAMGLDASGQALPNGATLSGTDAQTLLEEVDKAVADALENRAYDNAWEMIKTQSQVSVDLATGFLVGNQPNKDAAIAFKQALDTYMNIYGADADPVGFFNQNRGAYDIEKFDEPRNVEFAQMFPQVKRFMEIDEVTGEHKFSKDKQLEFAEWLTDAASRGTISEEEALQAAAQFKAFYQGQGVAPNDGELALEPDHPLYRQFEQWLMR